MKQNEIFNEMGAMKNETVDEIFTDAMKYLTKCVP
jgi:hypothetical protein